MSLTRPRTALLTGVLVVALLLTGAQVARSAPSLPAIEPDALLASVLAAADDRPPMAGELSMTLGLGLPALPGDGRDGMDGGGLGDLLGESRLRVERSRDGLRAAVLGSASERLVVTDGRTLSTWNSRTLEATITTLPSHDRPAVDDARGTARGSDPGAAPEDLDPAAVADRLLALACAHADVAVDGTARVAGRDAYRLVLTPTDAGTTLGRVEVDIDDATRTPLRTALFARGATAPSVELAWTRVSFDPIDPATFAFIPPPGATVVERDLGDLHAEAGPDAATGAPGALPDDLPGPLVILQQLAPIPGAPGPLVADGFASVAVLPMPRRGAGADDARPGDADGLGAVLPLDGPLLSVRVVEVGERRLVLAGLVPLARLDAVAAEVQAAATAAP